MDKENYDSYTLYKLSSMREKLNHPTHLPPREKVANIQEEVEVKKPKVIDILGISSSIPDGKEEEEDWRFLTEKIRKMREYLNHPTSNFNTMKLKRAGKIDKDIEESCVKTLNTVSDLDKAFNEYISMGKAGINIPVEFIANKHSVTPWRLATTLRAAGYKLGNPSYIVANK